MTYKSIGDFGGTETQVARYEKYQAWPEDLSSNESLEKIKKGPWGEAEADHIPPLSITSQTHEDTSFLSGLGIVASDIGSGAWDELTHHPLRVAGYAALGLGVGLVASRLPWTVQLGAGVMAGGWTLYQNGPKWWHSADVVTHEYKYAGSEVDRAHYRLQSLGAGAVDLSAGIVGGAFAPSFGSSVGRFFSSGSGGGSAADSLSLASETVANSTRVVTQNTINSAPIISTMLSQSWQPIIFR